MLAGVLAGVVGTGPPSAATVPTGPDVPAPDWEVTPADPVVGIGAVRAFTVTWHAPTGDRDVTGAASLAAGGGGIGCAGTRCWGLDNGTYPVRATVRINGGTYSQAIKVRVVPVEGIRLPPESTPAGVPVQFTAEGYANVADPDGKPVVREVGDLTARTAFAAEPPATCTRTGACTAERTGTYGVTGVVVGLKEPAEGRLTVIPGDPVELSLVPADSTVDVGAWQSYQVTGTDRLGNAIVDPAGVRLAIVPASGICEGLRCSAARAGTYEVRATHPGSGAEGKAVLRLVDRKAARLKLDPEKSEIVPGGRRRYRAIAYDGEDRRLGDVTARTTFSIDGTGSCEADACGAEQAATYIVTGRLSDGETTATGTAELTVRAGPPAALVVRPEGATVAAGAGQDFRVRGVDALRKDVGDLTGDAAFSIAPAGSCTGSRCSADAAGEYAVTAMVPRWKLSGTVTLHVTAPPVAELVLTPADATVVAGARQRYTVRGVAAGGLDVGDVTDRAVLRIEPPGSCAGGACSAVRPDIYRVVAELPGPDGRPAAVGRARLHVRAGAPDLLALQPASATVGVGGTVAYRVLGTDDHGNPLGDLTASAQFLVEPDGSCTRQRCTARLSGEHTVTALVLGARPATGRLTVRDGPVTRIEVAPDGATVAVDAARAFRVEGFDTAGRSLGDVTRTVELSIAPSGTCGGASCLGHRAGDHTVTGRAAGTRVTGSVTLHVVDPPPSDPPPSAGTDPPPGPGPVARLEITPRYARISAGAAVDYRVRAFDAAGTDLGDVTAGTAFSIRPDGSCSAGRCTAADSGPHTVSVAHARAAAAAILDVDASALVTGLVVEPADATVSVAAEQAYRVRALGADGADLGDVTDRAVLAVWEPGRCAAARCTADRPAELVVTATLPGHRPAGRARLHVVPTEPAAILLDPAAGSVTRGGAQPYRIRALDPDKLDLGDVTARTGLRIAPSGSCTDAVCIARRVGDHTVTATLLRRQGDPIVATVPLSVVAPPPGPVARLPWLLVAGGAALLLAGGAVLARIPAAPDRDPGRRHPSLPLENVRLDLHPPTVTAEIRERAASGPGWSVRVEPHPGLPPTSTLREGGSDDRDRP